MKRCWLRTKDPNWTRKRIPFARNFLDECFHVTFANFIFSYPKYYKYAIPLFLIYSFDNNDMKSSKRHVILLTLIFLLQSAISQKKVNVKKQRRFDRSTVIFKLKSKILLFNLKMSVERSKRRCSLTLIFFREILF